MKNTLPHGSKTLLDTKECFPLIMLPPNKLDETVKSMVKAKCCYLKRYFRKEIVSLSDSKDPLSEWSICAG